MSPATVSAQPSARARFARIDGRRYSSSRSSASSTLSLQRQQQRVLARIDLVVVAVVRGHARTPVAHEPGFLELGEVRGNARLREAKHGRELGDGQLLAFEQGEQPHARRIGEQTQQGRSGGEIKHVSLYLDRKINASVTARGAKVNVRAVRGRPGRYAPRPSDAFHAIPFCAYLLASLSLIASIQRRARRRRRKLPISRSTRRRTRRTCRIARSKHRAAATANALPLIVFLHGDWQDGTDNESQLAGYGNGSMELIDRAIAGRRAAGLYRATDDGRLLAAATRRRGRARCARALADRCTSHRRSPAFPTAAPACGMR